MLLLLRPQLRYTRVGDLFNGWLNTQRRDPTNTSKTTVDSNASPLIKSFIGQSAQLLVCFTATGNLERLSMSTLWNDLAPIAIVNGSNAIANASANVAGHPRRDGMNTAPGREFF